MISVLNKRSLHGDRHLMWSQGSSGDQHRYFSAILFIFHLFLEGSSYQNNGMGCQKELGSVYLSSEVYATLYGIHICQVFNSHFIYPLVRSEQITIDTICHIWTILSPHYSGSISPPHIMHICRYTHASMGVTIHRCFTTQAKLLLVFVAHATLSHLFWPQSQPSMLGPHVSHGMSVNCVHSHWLLTSILSHNQCNIRREKGRRSLCGSPTGSRGDSVGNPLTESFDQIPRDFTCTAT